MARSQTSADTNVDESDESQNLLSTIRAGSFLPITALHCSNQIDNDHLLKLTIDYSQGAKLSHYIAHFGNLKAFRYFVPQVFPYELEDRFGQTVVHYAARSGKLGILKLLSTKLPSEAFEQVNKYGVPPVLYALTNQKFFTFVYLYLNKRCQVTAE